MPRDVERIKDIGEREQAYNGHVLVLDSDVFYPVLELKNIRMHDLPTNVMKWSLIITVLTDDINT